MSNVQGNDPSTASPIGLPAARTLLDALAAEDPATRVEALHAMLRLSLTPDSWEGASDYLLRTLDDPSAPERNTVVVLATAVPIESVRGRLHEIATSRDDVARGLSARALADSGDAAGLDTLVGLLADETGPDLEEIARVLAHIDVSPAKETIERCCQDLASRPDLRPPEVYGQARFWLALALARAGDAAELIRLGKDNAVRWPRPSPVYAAWSVPGIAAEIHRDPPLSEEVVRKLEANPALASVLELPQHADVLRTDQPPAALGRDAMWPTADEREQVVRALGTVLTTGHDRLGYELDEALGGLKGKMDPPLALSIAVSEVLRRGLRRRAAASNPVEVGNRAVAIAGRADYVPDLEGLVDAAGFVIAHGGFPDNLLIQIAWCASRIGLEQMVAELDRCVKAGDHPLAALRLIAVAAEWASAPAPHFGGGGKERMSVWLEEPHPPPDHREGGMLCACGCAAACHGPHSHGHDSERHFVVRPDSGEGSGDDEPDQLETIVTPDDAPEPRWLLASVTDVKTGTLLQTAFRADAPHEFSIAIGPESELMMAAKGAEPIGTVLGLVPDMVQLLVVFVPPPEIADPMKGSLFLPKTGTSRRCTFNVQIPATIETFEAQVQLYHGNRMIQIGMLRGPVVPEPATVNSSIEFELSVLRPETPELESRPPYGVGLAMTTMATTAVAGDELILFERDEFDRIQQTLIGILSGIAATDGARSRDIEDSAVVNQLRQLVFQGCELHDAFAKAFGDREPERLQVLVERATDFFPVEFVYDLPAPKNDAGLCPGWRTALRTGTCPCPESHEKRGQQLLADHICPRGFWAFSKVIERQVVGEASWRQLDVADAGFAVRAYPSVGHDRLGTPTVMLFGASERVDGVRKGRIARLEEGLSKVCRTIRADTWDGWAEAVKSDRPSLLVLLSHTTTSQQQSALEIGKDDLCLLSQIGAPFLPAREERPVVLLLGCETAVTNFDLQTFVAKFQDLGAALVVGTTAAVLGERAAAVAQTIAVEFTKATERKRPIAAGELFLRIRRELLAKGDLTALCLTAFGDADWQLGGG
jgi:hypothetical protein